MTPTRAFVALGSNLGDRAARLGQAREGLAATPGVVIEAVSTVSETAPLGGLDQPHYLNQMARVNTVLGARELLAACHAVERAAGRERRAKWSSRTLDLDLVRYDDLLCDLPDLTLPHAGLRDRVFWMEQIAELETHG
ncbi:MAG TPA: 2-amino-4-hydroxy-6-hydroxymethyldihydropteridine diphosphokinase [Gemmatimonadales bacterium]|jgi:2-amino-4-hydroxy-6-hydroxymethyldihydropteridine diphosphokinase|nr:2-amino-4-hydroxy-6-hydroxymethyldihydropteridine diphosphokinase [Gemmatimonadales bacterium]